MFNDIRPDAMCIAEFWVVEPMQGTFMCPQCRVPFTEELEILDNSDMEPPDIDELAFCPECDTPCELTSTYSVYLDGI